MTTTKSNVSKDFPGLDESNPTLSSIIKLAKGWSTSGLKLCLWGHMKQSGYAEAGFPLNSMNLNNISSKLRKYKRFTRIENLEGGSVWINDDRRHLSQ